MTLQDWTLDSMRDILKFRTDSFRPDLLRRNHNRKTGIEVNHHESTYILRNNSVHMLESVSINQKEEIAVSLSVSSEHAVSNGNLSGLRRVSLLAEHLLMLAGGDMLDLNRLSFLKWLLVDNYCRFH